MADSTKVPNDSMLVRQSRKGRMAEEAFVYLVGATSWTLSLLAVKVYHPVRERRLAARP